MRVPTLPLTLLLSTAAALETIHSRQPELNTTSRSSSTISAAWYTGWHAQDFPLSRVNWSKYTNMIYAFAVTTPDVAELFLDTADEILLPQFVSTAHLNNVTASLSIGGWTGSRHFSTNVRTAQNRTAFVKTVTAVAQKYELDGLDFDWEYPAVQGIGCNTYNRNDLPNFLTFLQELRNSTIGKDLILSAAATLTPWIDSSGSPAKDISEFSKVLDYITIMNYDIRSNPANGAGPNSPLNDNCAPAGTRSGSAVSAVDAWTAAGMPHDQILLGIPAYGRSYVVPPAQLTSSNVTQLSYPPFDLSLERPGDRWDGVGGLDVCGVMQGPSGVYTYWGLMAQGFLNQDGSVIDGIDYRFDECSNTPYLYNPSSHVFISYDDPQSFAMKGGFIHSAGLKGFVMWEAGGDSGDALLDSMLNATQNGGPTSLAPASAQTAPQAAMSSATHTTFLKFHRTLNLHHAFFLIGFTLCTWLT